MKLSFGPSQMVKTTKLTIFIPNKDKYGNLIETIYHWVNEAQFLFTTLFGGCTCIHQAKGMWYNETDGIFMDETTAIVTTYVNIEDLQKHLNTIQRFVQNFLTVANQDAVAIEYDGYMYFVSCMAEVNEAVV